MGEGGVGEGWRGLGLVVRWHITINFFPLMMKTMDDADDIRRQGRLFLKSQRLVMPEPRGHSGGGYCCRCSG